jgi:ATP-dependent Zn protease
MNAHARAYQFLDRQKDILIQGAKTLMEKESMNEDELKKIFDRINIIDELKPEIQSGYPSHLNFQG